MACIADVCVKPAAAGGSLAAGSAQDNGAASDGKGISPQPTAARFAGTIPAAQWTQTNWSAGNSFFDLCADQDWVFARIWDSLDGGRVFLTADSGASWTLIGSADSETDILSIVKLNSDLLAGTWNGLYLSSSGGASWTAVTPSGIPEDTAIWTIAKLDTTLFAGTIGHVYKSSDNGSSWAEASSGIPATAIIASFVTSGSAILASSNANGVFRTTNGGASWTAVNSGLVDTRVSQLAVSGTRLLAVTSGGLFVSTNNGTSWTADASGLEKINCLLAVSDQLLAGTDNNGVHLSADSGVTWTAFNSGMTDGARVWSLAASSDNVFAGTDSGVWRTPLVPNAPPTVVTAASASPNPVAGTTTSLSVLGADDGGEASLTYTWAALGTPPAAVAFGANGTNAAKNTTATFSQAGTYTLQVTVQDQPGLSATSSVAVTVDQTLTSIVVAPASASVAPLGAQPFVATAQDQFGTAMATQPTFTWSVSGGGNIDANGLFTADATLGGPFTVTAESGAMSGTATVSVAVPNVGPSISVPAAATPNPVTGNSTALSVLGDDDAGEANLTYTWATVGTPPAPVTFGANGTNAAKNTTATFTKAGSYNLLVTVADQPGLTVTSSVTVTVSQTLTSIVVSPASATIDTGASQQFSATARDQFGTNLAPQPTFTWTVSDGGTIGASGLFTAGSIPGGPHTVTATSGGVSGTASVTLSALPTTVYQINTGSNSAASPFSGDQYGSGGTMRTITNSITISGITDPAPMAVYQSERYGNSTYTLPGLTPGSQYTARLHFAELYWTATGRRRFNVVINGTTVLSNYDIYAVTGARYKAVVREFTTTANSSGQIVINFQTVTDNATIEGIEIIALTPNYPPNIVTAAAAAPNPVSGSATSLSALGNDDGGEANLTYTWAAIGTPPAGVSFGANGTNASKNTTATFSKAGSYNLQVTVADQPGLTTTSSVVVTVDQTLTSITVAPASTTVEAQEMQQFIATARDQFAAPLAAQPGFAWSVSGGGTIDANGLFTAYASGGGPYTVTAQSGGLSGTATVSVTVPNIGPTVAIPAAATPNPVTGNNTTLSVLGDDDAGEANLTYTWATTGTPPAAVTFSANGSNAAKNTNAIFTKAGSYTLQVTLTDQGYLTATSSVVVNVDQTPTSVVVSPGSATLNTGGGQQFTATARDQFGANLATQPSFAWTVSGGGSISASGYFSAGSSAGGPYTVTATGGGLNGTASVTVTAMPTTVYQINTGSNSAASPFTGDQYGSGGTMRTVSNTITISGITDPAPMAVYQSERYGNSTYTLPGLTPGSQYTVRLHFAELYQTATGRRRFNVVINGTTVLSSFDIYAETGARYKAAVREFTTTANSSGQIVINFQTVTDNATIEGIEIIALTPNNPPSIVAAATAAPNPVAGSATVLSALGDDDGGEAGLTYTWAAIGTPPAGVSFSANGTNAAKNTTATFTKAGSYNFQVAVADQAGLTVTSQVTVTVNQTLTSVVVSPVSATVNTGGSQQFTATARDQFGTNLVTQPSFTWSVSGGGTIGASGLFTAGVSAGGPYTVTAQSGGTSGTAMVSVVIPNAAPTIATPAAANPSPVLGTTTALSVLGADDGGEGNLIYTWATTGTPPAAVVFSANGTNAAKSTTATFSKAGSYSFQVTVRDQPGLTANSSVSVTVNQTVTSIVVSPSSASVNTSATQQFTATARDQFATALVTQPTFTWTVSGGGTVGGSGLFTAGSTAGGPYTVTAASAGVNGTASVTVTAVNAAPTIATAAAASPSPVTGTTTALSVLGADDGGEGNLTYTWATTGTPPASVSFSANGSNAAKNTTATFTKAGNYTFQVTVRDQPGLTATSTVNVTVSQTLTSILVSPASATVNTSATQQFTATARDQFTTDLGTQPSFTWTVSGGGSISASGLFTAGSTAGGPYTVTASSGGKSGTASVTVTGGSNPCAGLCTSPVVFTSNNYQSGNLGTGATCHETTANLMGGNCSNISGRTLKVNNTTMSCNGWALPAKRNGGYCIQVTAGEPSWTSFATW